MTPVYLYDSLQPATNWIPSYSGPLVESECNQALFAKIADASAIFGDASVLAGAEGMAAPDFSLTSLSSYLTLTDNIVFKAVVVALFIYYFILVFHFRDCIATLFKLVKIRFDGSTLLNDSTYIFALFLRSTTILWFVACGVAIVKFAEIVAGDQIASSLPQWAVLMLIVPAATVLALVMLYKKIVMHLVEKITLSESFVHVLNYIKTLYTAVAVLVIAPTILLLAQYNGDLQNELMYLLVVEAVTITCLWLYKTYMVFIEQNVSILHWFLYLCAIEIFPFTLLILISLRLT